jgi:hypothetical protein
LPGIKKEKSKEDLHSSGSGHGERKTIFVDQSLVKQLVNAETETATNQMSI